MISGGSRDTGAGFSSSTSIFPCHLTLCQCYILTSTYHHQLAQQANPSIQHWRTQSQPFAITFRGCCKHREHYFIFSNDMYYFWTAPSLCGPYSSVGIVTSHGLDSPGIESRWGARFSAPVQTGPGAHSAFCTIGTGSFPGVKIGRGVMLTPHPHLVPLVKKG